MNALPGPNRSCWALKHCVRKRLRSSINRDGSSAPRFPAAAISQSFISFQRWAHTANTDASTAAEADCKPKSATNRQRPKKKAIVGLSGGVDSSVSAYLLHKKGYEVTGLYMRNWDRSDEQGTETCPSEKEYQDVQNVCEQIGIRCQKGITPNPDILCNREIKFNRFYAHALSLGADYVATGHYARIEHRRDGQLPLLLRGVDPNKDQSYFLAAISGKVLSNVLFPVGDLLKSEVREIARDAGLYTAEKKDSTGICFIGKRNFPDFIASYIEQEPGEFVDVETGDSLGPHKGLSRYTVGQGARIAGRSEKWFVADKDMKRNLVFVAGGTTHPALYYDTVYAHPESFNWISGEVPAQLSEENQILRCSNRVRYRQKIAGCSVSLQDVHRSTISAFDSNAMEKSKQLMYRIDFDEPQRAPTPGQFAVLYDGDICLGGAKIVARGESYLARGKEIPEEGFEKWAA